MISKKMQEAINEQINKELYSGYLYLSMAAYFDALGYEGFAHFMKVQAKEEYEHAMKFYEYLNDRGGRVILKQIDEPQIDFDSVNEVFDLSYKHEQFVTKSINELVDLASKENDHASVSFLNWYVDEQVEEEATMDAILTKLEMIDGKGMGLLMLDRELAKREA
jgi:ferritin